MTCIFIILLIFQIDNNDAYRKEHAWEKKLESSWNDLQEDKNGSLMYISCIYIIVY